jgi:glycosyltransferase involved in cell wall biosynthesis
MNILHVTLAFPPAYSWGGPVKIVHQICMELAKRGHNITVICTNLLDKRNTIEPGTTVYKQGGMTVVYFKTINFPWWPGTIGPIWMLDLPNWINKMVNDFDVIHIHGYRNTFLMPVNQTARKADVPFIISPHGSMSMVINSTFSKRIYDKTMGIYELRGLSALIALNNSESMQAQAVGVPPDRIRVIPNGLDPSLYSITEKGSFRRKWNIPENQPLLLFVGRINRKKGPDMLIKAFDCLDRDDAWLAIVGPDDGQLDEVTQLVRLFNLEKRVIFTGLLAGQDLLAAYNDADLFILPCRTDTFPTTIMEACLANTPMVITEGCEIASLVQNRIGEVVQFDAQDIAQGIQILLSDHERYEYYRSNCPSVMENSFSLSSTVDTIVELYSDVISREQ